MTFVWDVVESGKVLAIQVRYGDGTGTDNVGKATIPMGSTDPVSVQAAPNREITVKGSVQAGWGDGNKSYVVTFSGRMVRGSVNNVFSSDQLSAGVNPIIVGAYLSE